MTGIHIGPQVMFRFERALKTSTIYLFPIFSIVPMKDLETIPLPFSLPEIQPDQLNTIISFTGGI